jgi:hypothetical protein
MYTRTQDKNVIYDTNTSQRKKNLFLQLAQDHARGFCNFDSSKPFFAFYMRG